MIYPLKNIKHLEQYIHNYCSTLVVVVVVLVVFSIAVAVIVVFVPVFVVIDYRALRCTHCSSWQYSTIGTIPITLGEAAQIDLLWQ